MNEAIIWLIRLLAAHLISDFLLQPDSWVEAKREKQLRANEFWYHITLVTFFTVLFTGFSGWWWIAPTVFITHFLIDWWKCQSKKSWKMFLADQALHILVIFIIWKIKFPEENTLTDLVNISESSFWIVLFAMTFLTRPVGVVIGMLTAQFRKQIEKFDKETLAKAGTWIGILERLVVFFLVLIEQWEAMGLLVAAKSIIRLKDGDQKMSEYVLIGTLISISVAVLTGYIVSKLI
ncbi:MAG TPA: DUF3307 domain-containing protein [Bacteroidales bacterium]|nr:DUF3307 domain-containing protein [Bacteroidales bacterium]